METGICFMSWHFIAWNSWFLGLFKRVSFYFLRHGACNSTNLDLEGHVVLNIFIDISIAGGWEMYFQLQLQISLHCTHFDDTASFFSINWYPRLKISYVCKVLFWWSGDRGNTNLKWYYLKYCVLNLLVQGFYVSYVFGQLCIFNLLSGVRVTKYISFCSVIIDTVNRRI